MTGNNNDKEKPNPIDELYELDELPPLDHDEPEESNPEELASFLEPIPEDDLSREAIEGTESLEKEFDPLTVAQELLDEDEQNSSFIEDWEDRPMVEIDVAIDEEDESFTNDEDSKPVEDLENDWFLEDELNADTTIDEGEEGPTNEKMDTFGINEDAWDPMEEDEEEDEEEPLEAMERLGIDLPVLEDEDLPPSSLVLDKQFLGPEGGGIATVVFQGGSLVAAGEGLFSLGADGMFHASLSENAPSMSANSVYVRGESIFLGTNEMGVLVTHDKGNRFRQLNAWFTQGLLRGVQASSEQVSTSFKIHGQEAPSGYWLLGCTGRGQLFSSVDGGKTWRSLAIPGQCLALATIVGTSELFMATRSKDGKTALWNSKNTDDWEPTVLPDFWPESTGDHNISIAAVKRTIVIGSDDIRRPLAFSLDSGNTWNKVDGACSATAVTLDPDDPSCMAAAFADPTNGHSTVYFSENKGRSWQTILRLDGNKSNTITSLAINSGRTREVVAVTQKGVYLVTLTRKGVSH